MTGDEMVGWHHWLNAQEFEQTLWDVEDREVWCISVLGLQRVGHDWMTELNWSLDVCPHFRFFT